MGPCRSGWKLTSRSLKKGPDPGSNTNYNENGCVGVKVPAKASESERTYKVRSQVHGPVAQLGRALDF